MNNSPMPKPMNDSICMKRKQNAAKSLNNYMEQIKLHFDLNDKDIISILELVLKERRNENFIKKWWQILK